MDNLKRKKTLAWIAVGTSAVFANLWAFWGINENFHEGWYSDNLWSNVLMMVGQYLLVPITFMLLAVVSIRWNKIGAIAHLVLAIGASIFFRGMSGGALLIALPLVGLALLYWFGRLEKRKVAYFLVVILPLAQILGIGTFHVSRVINRYGDNDFQTRSILGNGLELIWAPQGPGWPDSGTSWGEAKLICAYLSEDGTTVTDKELNIWRLPTVDEAVRSMVYHGTNAGGVWDSTSRVATYKEQPDKESPLWNMHLKTIYWWTSSEVNEKQAYIVVYNGGVWPRAKTLKAGYLNFRAVKDIGR